MHKMLRKNVTINENGEQMMSFCLQPNRLQNRSKRTGGARGRYVPAR